MAKFKIDGNEYDTEKLSKESQIIVNSLIFIRAEIEKHNSQIAICKTAEVSYAKALKTQIEKDTK